LLSHQPVVAFAGILFSPVSRDVVLSCEERTSRFQALEAMLNRFRSLGQPRSEQLFL
jgi:hypothetical protein